MEVEDFYTFRSAFFRFAKNPPGKENISSRERTATQGQSARNHPLQLSVTLDFEWIEMLRPGFEPESWE